MGYNVNVLGILIGLAFSTALNLIQGATGISRQPFNAIALALFIFLIIYVICTHEEEEPAREKKKEN